MNIAIQGGEGSYHQEAAENHIAAVSPYIGEDHDIVFVPTFPEVFDGLAAGKYNRAVVAIANNRVGFIPEPHTRLIRDSGSFRIVGETYVRVDHQLLGLPGARLSDIEEVHSQAPAIAQCLEYLSKRLPNASIVEQSDTALSAQLVSRRGNPHSAAIASKRAGIIHGLVPIESSIQDDRDNITRFVVLARTGDDVPELGVPNKTTWLLDTGQQAGALVSALMPFKEARISIESLHSLFVPNSAFDMQFWMEFDAGVQDERMVGIRQSLSEIGCSVKSLGSYVSRPVPMSNLEQSNTNKEKVA